MSVADEPTLTLPNLPDTRASIDQGVLASLFENNQTYRSHNSSLPYTSFPLTPLPSSSLPSTTVAASTLRTEVWISRLPNTPPVTEADYESQV